MLPELIQFLSKWSPSSWLSPNVTCVDTVPSLNGPLLHGCHQMLPVLITASGTNDPLLHGCPQMLPALITASGTNDPLLHGCHQMLPELIQLLV
jgi:hypothetical protein